MAGIAINNNLIILEVRILELVVMISTKKELMFFLRADSLMNLGYFKRPLKKVLRDLFVPDYTMQFLRAMRRDSFYANQSGPWNKIRYGYNRLRKRKLGIKLGWSIDSNALGYGLLLPHYGTIVVGPNHIGNYAVLHTSTCITGNMKTIGNALYLATGAKITSKVVLGDNITVAANSVVTKSFPDGNILLAGMPATELKSSEPWYIRDGSLFSERVRRVEELKIQMGLNNI